MQDRALVTSPRAKRSTISSWFRLSPRPIIRVLPVADYSLIVVDDLYADPWAVRDVALSLDYTVRRASYPGPEAAVWVPEMPLCRFLGELLSHDTRTEVVPVRAGSHQPIPREHRFQIG